MLDICDPNENMFPVAKDWFHLWKDNCLNTRQSIYNNTGKKYINGVYALKK
jgi:hypothetical protein